MAEAQNIPERPKPLNFHYDPLLEPLKETRLVHLEPASSESSEIKITLHTAKIGDDPYEALSYAWGDPKITLPITVNGISFEVTTNLFHALQNLRQEKITRILWIDAICIDQKNDVERGQHVGNMAAIYEAASRVVVWLGRYAEPEDDAHHFEENLWGFSGLEPGTLETTKSAFGIMDKVYDKEDVSDVPNEHWGHLSRILKRSWFRRLWVVQEVKMSRETMILCGKFEMEWEILEGAVAQYCYVKHPKINDTTLPFFFHLGSRNVGEVCLWNADRTNILSLILKTSGTLATDPRDRLFAIQGLLHVTDADIVVNYSEPVEVVYREWAWNRIVRTGNLDVLSLCGDSGSAGSVENGGNGVSLPSWVPDLRDLHHVDDVLFNLTIRGPRNSPAEKQMSYNASGLTNCGGVRRQDNPNILALPSIKIDKIIKKIPLRVIRTFDYVEDNRKRLEQLKNWEREVEEHFNEKLEPDSELFLSLVDTFFSGRRLHGEKPLNSLPILYQHYRQNRPIPEDYMADSPDEVRIDHYFRQLHSTLRTFCHGTDMFITEKGYLGYARVRCLIEVGDEVHVLFGGKTPHVLCTVEGMEATNDYMLQGPCYLSGFMDGQAVELCRKGVVDPEVISIW